METILGIDPGSRITGFGIIQSDGLRHRYVTSGCIRMQNLDLPIRLQQIFEGLREVITTHQPEYAAIEQVFMHQNAGSALKLGHARGVAMVVAAIHALPLAEYTARQIKQAVVGYGAAKKNQVQHMIKTLLNLSAYPQADAADALAVAICHAHSRFSLGNIRHASVRHAKRKRPNSVEALHANALTQRFRKRRIVLGV